MYERSLLENGSTDLADIFIGFVIVKARFI